MSQISILHEGPDIQLHVIGHTEGTNRVISAIAQTIELSAATYETAEAYLSCASRDRPACVITELTLTTMSGLSLLQELARLQSAASPVVLTRHTTVVAAMTAMQSGAFAFLEMPVSNELLLATIRQAMHTSRTRLSHLLRRQETQHRLNNLGAEERSVLDYVIRGMKNRAIAGRLAVSVRTVEARRQRICKKLGVSSVPELVRVVLDAGESIDVG